MSPSKILKPQDVTQGPSKQRCPPKSTCNQRHQNTNWAMARSKGLAGMLNLQLLVFHSWPTSIVSFVTLSQEKPLWSLAIFVSVYQCNHSAQWGKAVSVSSIFNSQIPIVDMMTKRLTNALRHWEKTSWLFARKNISPIFHMLSCAKKDN